MGAGSVTLRWRGLPAAGIESPMRNYMKRSWDLLGRWWYQDDRGATAVEYSLLAVLVAAVIVAVVAALGTNVSSAFQGFINAF